MRHLNSFQFDHLEDASRRADPSFVSPPFLLALPPPPPRFRARRPPELPRRASGTAAPAWPAPASSPPSPPSPRPTRNGQPRTGAAARATDTETETETQPWPTPTPTLTRLRGPFPFPSSPPPTRSCCSAASSPATAGPRPAWPGRCPSGPWTGRGRRARWAPPPGTAPCQDEARRPPRRHLGHLPALLLLPWAGPRRLRRCGRGARCVLRLPLGPGPPRVGRRGRGPEEDGPVPLPSLPPAFGAAGGRGRRRFRPHEEGQGEAAP